MRIARFTAGNDVAYGVVQEAPQDGAARSNDELTVAELSGHPFGVGGKN